MLHVLSTRAITRPSADRVRPMSERRFSAQKCTVEISINPDTAEAEELSGTQSDV